MQAKVSLAFLALACTVAGLFWPTCGTVFVFPKLPEVPVESFLQFAEVPEDPALLSVTMSPRLVPLSRMSLPHWKAEESCG